MAARVRDTSAISIKRHVVIGVAAGVLLLVIYAGVISLAQGWQHLLEQTAKRWYWIAALSIGFGIQAGLFSFIRQSLRQRRISASMVTSGGVSGGSMVACCAHHLADALPLIGIAGLTAFLVRYQDFFLILGVVSNMVGIALMLETIQRHGLCPLVANWKLNMRPVTRGVIILAVLALIFAGARIAAS